MYCLGSPGVCCFLGLLAIAVIKRTYRSNLGGKLYLVQIIVTVGKLRQKELEAASHITVTVERRMNEGVRARMPVMPSLFFSVGSSPSDGGSSYLHSSKETPQSVFPDCSRSCQVHNKN